jgi:hypothetical protein
MTRVWGEAIGPEDFDSEGVGAEPDAAMDNPQSIVHLKVLTPIILPELSRNAKA